MWRLLQLEVVVMGLVVGLVVAVGLVAMVMVTVAVVVVVVVVLNVVVGIDSPLFGSFCCGDDQAPPIPINHKWIVSG